MHPYTTDEIITGIAARKNNVIQHIYKTCYDPVRRLILMNKGTDEDARDIFQEALFTIYQKITLQKFQLNCSFSTYMYSVCRFLWVRELTKKKEFDNITDEFPDIISAGSLNPKIELAGLKIFQKHFNELCENCQKVLRLYFRNVSLEEISEIMGYKNVQIARDKKYRCKQNLLTSIYNDPEYQKLKNEILQVG
jgi:RNA polymerase sigma factor (sigma-70 family)